MGGPFGPDALTALAKARWVGGGPGSGHTNHDTSLLLLPLARATMCASRARYIPGWEGGAEGMGRVVKTTFRDTTKGRKRGGRCDTTVNFTQGQGQGRLIEKVRVAGKVPQEQWSGEHFSPECATRCQIQHLEATNGEERGSGEHAGRKEKEKAQAAIEGIIGTKTTGG